jgi:hypothetical protein
MEVDKLEHWVVEYQKAGQEWVAAKLKADQLDDFTKSLVAKIENAFEETAREAGEKISESKLERLAFGSQQYQQHIKAANMARSEMLSKRVRFDAMDKWFEAKRSGLSFEKEIIKKGIFNQGS